MTLSVHIIFKSTSLPRYRSVKQMGVSPLDDYTCRTQPGRLVFTSLSLSPDLDASKVQTQNRLHGIDAPETKQDFGMRAKDALAEKVFGREVRLVKRDVDRYGRIVADVFIGERLINRELVAEGWAWHYVKYAPREAELAAAEKLAREKKLGLWSHPSPIAPWDFRKPAAQPAIAGMVYVTTNGKKYYRPDCRHLDASAKAIPLEEAKKTREPCKACRPEQ